MCWLCCEVSITVLCAICVSSIHMDVVIFVFFFFKQKTAYEMRISDWSSDVCSSDLDYVDADAVQREVAFARRMFADNGWSVIDVTRRSIEETAAAVIALVQQRDALCV